METSNAAHEVPNCATSSPAKLEHETTTTIHTNSATYSTPAIITKIALHPSYKKLRPSSSTNSSSPDSPLDDPFHNDNYDDNDDDDDDNKSTSITSSSSSAAAAASSSPEHKHNTNPNSSNESSPTEAPSAQTMDRSSPYFRIPSSVFARSQSTTPMEWSVASNESLFSIHTGNESFRNDSSFWRSGELGGSGGAASDRMFSYKHQPATGPAADMRSRELGLAEATMKEVIKESELGRDYEASLAAAVRGCRRSHGSDTSTTSFAFSLMAGEGEKCSAVRTPSSVRSSQEQVHHLPEQKHPHPQLLKTETVQPPAYNDQPKTPAAKENPTPQSRWFSCFPCCSCAAS